MDMNGIEVTRRIRKEVGDKAPILILTAYDWADIEEEAKDGDCDLLIQFDIFR